MELSENQKEQLAETIKECAEGLSRIKTERTIITGLLKDISKDFDIPKKTLNKMVKVYYKNNFAEEVEEQDQFVTLYEEIVNEKKN